MMQKIRVFLHQKGFITLEHIKGNGYEVFVLKTKNGNFSVDLHVGHNLYLHSESVEFPSLELRPLEREYYDFREILQHMEQIAVLDERFK